MQHYILYDGQLDVHRRDAHGIKRAQRKRKPKIECNVCNKSCKTREAFQIHMRHHTGERPYKCKMCKKSFISAKVRHGHMRLHLAKQFRDRYACEFCDARFTYKRGLDSHLKLHTGTVGFECGACALRFRFRRQLRRHVIASHTGDSVRQESVTAQPMPQPAASTDIKVEVVVKTEDVKCSTSH